MPYLLCIMSIHAVANGKISFFFMAKKYSIDTGRWAPWRSEGVYYAAGEEQRAIANNSRKNEVVGPKSKQHSVVDVTGDESKDVIKNNIA